MLWNLYLLILKKSLDVFAFPLKWHKLFPQKNWQHFALFQTMLLTHFLLVNIPILKPLKTNENLLAFLCFQEVWNRTVAKTFFKALPSGIKRFKSNMVTNSGFAT